MGAIRFFILLCLLLILASANVFGSGFSFDGVGVKANGMGGAFRAIADDWSAAYYNPAGYNQIMDNQLSGNVVFFHNRYNLTPNVLWGGIYETGFYNNQEIYNKYEVNHRLEGGILARLPIFGRDMTLGFSYLPLFNEKQSWELMQNIPAHTPESLPAEQFGIELNVDAYQFTAARGFMEDKLSIGIGLSAMRGKLTYTDIALRTSPIEAPLDDRPHDKIPEWYKSEGDAWALGYRLGALYQATEKLRLGLTYTGKTSFDISGRTNFKFFMGSNPDTTIYVTTQQLEELLFMKGEVIEAVADFETTLDIPATISGGIAYDVSEKLTVSLDAEMVFWSEFKGFEFNFSDFAGAGSRTNIFRNQDILTDTVYDRAQEMIFTDLSAPIVYDDAAKIMLGINYKPYEFVNVRLGFSSDQSALNVDNIDQVTLIPQFFDIGSSYSLSFGLGFDVDVWSLEMATVYTNRDDLTITTQYDLDGDGLMDNIVGKYGGNNVRTTLGLSYRF